jgi:Tfp pilus assembly protein PilO
MKNLYKIIIIAVVFILSIFILILIVRPVLTRSGSHIARLTEEKAKNITLNSELDNYITARDDYYLINAEYQKLNMELPEKSDLSILTNELYEIARFTVVEIENLSFNEAKLNEEDLKTTPSKEITIDLILRGSYYEILNYINTMEIMPRLIKIEDVMAQTSGNENNDLLVFVIAKTYFANEYYK